MEEREKGVGDGPEGFAAGAYAGVGKEVWVEAEETEEEELEEEEDGREEVAAAARE